MIRMVKYALFGILFVAAAFGQEETRKQADSPFGLTWLASKEEVEHLGVKFQKVEFKDFGESYQAANLPKALADQATTFLSFGFDNKLVRIAAIGRTNEHDGYGATVKSRYEEIKGVLEKKYGKGKEVAHTQEHYTGEDFAMGLANGKNWLFTMIETPEMTVELGAIGESLSGTFWRIIFEHKAGMNTLKTHSKQKEEETL